MATYYTQLPTCYDDTLLNNLFPRHCNMDERQGLALAFARRLLTHGRTEHWFSTRLCFKDTLYIAPPHRFRSREASSLILVMHYGCATDYNYFGIHQH